MANCDACAVSDQDRVEGASTSQQGTSPLEGRTELIKNKIIVVAGKEGIGKSTIAVNLAFALAKRGTRVGLLDLDVYGSRLLKMLALEGEVPQVKDNDIYPFQVAGIKVMPISSLPMRMNGTHSLRESMSAGVIQQHLANVVWGDLDYLILDCPSGMGEESIRAVSSVEAGSLAVVVATPQEIASIDVKIPLNFCKEQNLPVIGVIENMSADICPHCAEYTGSLKSDGACRLVQNTGHELLARIPFNPQIVIDGETGDPHLLSEPHSEISKAYISVAESVATYCSQTKQSCESFIN